MPNNKLLFWPEIAECVDKARCESVLQADNIEDLLQRDPPVPDEEIQQILFHKSSPINFVKWKGLPLLGLSPLISNLTSLTQLVLEDNSLKTIPDEIGLCKSLKMADFTRNQLTKLPATMKDLVHLESLIVTNNETGFSPDTSEYLTRRERPVVPRFPDIPPFPCLADDFLKITL
ncbi:hypothetical protein L596_018405 [Steinernema carpocapsae]|uniref:Uncharacterized protein n=1 Tax=Steinernema carpocapsae TaxID=34508 RepID=A0A4U5N4W0_STECR|nr:hypothetical protein L596_018405 [Steinernema carpocapsae]